jgi:hypothetical protein
MVLSNSPITIGNLTLNSVDANGTKWIVQKFDGWGTSAPTLQPVQKPRQSGASVGDSFSTGRTLTMSGLIVSQSAAQHSADWDTLISNVSRTPTPLLVSESGYVRWLMVQRSADIVPTRLNNMMSQFTFQVFSKDWRKFGQPGGLATALSSATGGIGIPLQVPFIIDSVVVSGQVNAFNPGNEVGPVTVRIDGPCTGPVVTHIGSSQPAVFSSSLVLNAGEFLIIDMEKHSVLGNGQAPRDKYTTSRGFSGFEPGLNTWTFTAAVYDAASQMTVTYTPAWE